VVDTLPALDRALFFKKFPKRDDDLKKSNLKWEDLSVRRGRATLTI